MNSFLESVSNSEFKIMYKNVLCNFIPNNNYSLKEIPNTIEGKVIFIGEGEYNPIGWYRDITVNKEDIIYIPKHNNKYANYSTITR